MKAHSFSRYLTPLLVLLLPSGAEAQTGIEASVMRLYEANSERFEALTGGLTPDQWGYRPSESAWTIAEIVEHIVLNERWVLEALAGLTQVEPTDQQILRAAAVERQAVALLRDRSQKFPAPEFLVPTGSLGNVDGVVEAFRDTRAEMVAKLKSVDFDPRTRTAMHFALGEVDAATWAAILGVACRRGS